MGLLINVLIIYGVYAVTREGKLWGFMPKGYYLVKPIYDCTVCMSSFWGVIYYLNIYQSQPTFSFALATLFHCLKLAGFIYLFESYVIEILEYLKIKLK